MWKYTYTWTSISSFSGMQVFRKYPEFRKFYWKCLDIRKYLLYKRIESALSFQGYFQDFFFCDLHPVLPSVYGSGSSDLVLTIYNLNGSIIINAIFARSLWSESVLFGSSIFWWSNFLCLFCANPSRCWKDTFFTDA